MMHARFAGARGFRAQVSHVDVAELIAGDRDDFHSGHDGAGGIGPVRGSGNQTDVAMRLLAIFEVGANDEQSGEFALRTGVRLQRHSAEAGDFREPLFQFRKELLITARLRERRKRMNASKLRPRDRIHFGGRVEFHGAGPERDHALIETEILRLQLADVAHHLRFGVVRVEDGMLQKLGFAREGRRDFHVRVGSQMVEVEFAVLVVVENLEQHFQVFLRGGFIE